MKSDLELPDGTPLETAPLRLNARMILRRLEAFLGQTGAIRCEGTGSDLFLEEARAAGWPTDHPDTVVRVGAVSSILPENATLLCQITDHPVEAPEGFRLVQTRPLRLYQSLGFWTVQLCRRLPLLRSLVGPVAALTRKLGIDRVMGDRSCALRIPGWREMYFGRGDVAKGLVGDEKADARKDLAMSFFRAGYFPLMPGTLAAAIVPAVFLPLQLLLPVIVWWPLLLAVFVVSTGLCVVLEPWSTRFYLVKDAREVVLDEVAGMSLTLLLCPPALAVYLAVPAFLAFRFFDIVKPGIHWIENRSWRGSVVWDDLLAGLYAGLVCLALGLLLTLL